MFWKKAQTKAVTNDPFCNQPETKKMFENTAGLGGGQVVSVLAFYIEDLTSNPAKVYN